MFKHPDSNWNTARCGMQWISREQVGSVTLATLGLDGSALNLASPEAIAEMLRRIGSFHTPCAAITLRRRCREILKGAVEEKQAAGLIDSTLDALIAYGDFVELAGDGDSGVGARLYLSPFRFVARPTGLTFLVGIEPDGRSALPSDLSRRIERIGHIRRLQPRPHENLRARLLALGLAEQRVAEWLTAPSYPSAEHALRAYGAELSRQGRSGEVAGLQIIDPSMPVDFYRGRWVEPKRHSGRFVGRREQRFGSSLWCYVELDAGTPVRMLDLGGGEWRGCDEAWYLQAAIDSENGTPQRFRIERGTSRAGIVLEFFSPLPQWVERRLYLVGQRVTPSRGLLGYRIEVGESDTEISYLTEQLWLRSTD